jgi:hypothetical protein
VTVLNSEKYSIRFVCCGLVSEREDSLMNRSSGATLLITVFALAVLGIAASTLYTAHPDAIYQGSSPTISGRSPTGGTSEVQSGSDGQPVRLFAFPDINVDQGLKNSSQSQSTIQRLAIGLVLLFLGAILLIRHLTSNDPHAETPTDEVTDTTGEKSVPETPVVSASNPPPMNDVYRAWRAMIMSLDAPLEKGDTPTDLAGKAIRDGFPETPVTELTALFCSVRYGGKPPSDEREQSAQHALDQVQQTDRSNDAESPGSDTVGRKRFKTETADGHVQRAATHSVRGDAPRWGQISERTYDRNYER